MQALDQPPTEAPATTLIGQRIGSYVVKRELGAGGTGTVYLCEHTMIERDVAVKVLHEEQARDPEQVARFFQEARAAAEIGHPNIISIIDFGHIETLPGRPPYLMMESLEGMSLDKRLRQGGMSLAEIAHIMSQVCSALAASHGKGIIHRDLKPPNVYLCDRTFDHQFVKVLDFGTAKLTVPHDGYKTMIGMVLGTPAYMSPEQCDGQGIIDHRSDIYSLGCMLYEMLTGRLPFEGEIGEMLLHQMFHAPIPPRAINPTIPPEWEALCLRMMEKQREDRFQSVTDLAHALEDLEGHAAAYESFRAERAATGKSGHTLVATAERLGLAPEEAPARSQDDRATIHGNLEEFAARAPAPIYPDAPPPSPAFTPPMERPDPIAACATLVADPRYIGFARTLMIRPGGRWYDVVEVCRTGQVAPPATLPLDQQLFATWLEHPRPAPGLAAIAFLSLVTGWSTVLVCPRTRW